MSRGGRAELERRVQEYDRAHPTSNAREIESELARSAPIRYGEWIENTPNRESRLRQIQRWRTGATSGPKRPADRPLFHHIWPVGERQRHELEPSFSARATSIQASHRLFLHNCSEETLREIQIVLAGVEVGYEPSLAPGRFLEIKWFKNPRIRALAMEAAPHGKIVQPLAVEFAVARGTRTGRLSGEIRFDASDGWESFRSADNRDKELY